MKDEKKLRDILDAISSIELYSVSDYEAFLEDEKTQDAIWKLLQDDLSVLKTEVLRALEEV